MLPAFSVFPTPIPPVAEIMGMQCSQVRAEVILSCDFWGEQRAVECQTLLIGILPDEAVTAFIHLYLGYATPSSPKLCQISSI